MLQPLLTYLTTAGGGVYHACLTESVINLQLFLEFRISLHRRDTYTKIIIKFFPVSSVAKYYKASHERIYCQNYYNLHHLILLGNDVIEVPYRA